MESEEESVQVVKQTPLAYQRRDLNIQRSLASGKPLQEAWFQFNGHWVKYYDHKELESRILVPISQREIDVAVWEYNQNDLFPDI